jgi:transposase
VFSFETEAIMQDVTLIGIDLGKHSFHVHGQDRHGKALLRKKFSRKQLIEFLATFHACTVVMEACAGAHYMARQLAGYGHDVKLISPQFVRPFVKSNKNDFVDAEAICEAASRPSMRFVTPKTEAQQTLSALHRVRESLVRDRTKTSNQIHAFLLEFGISLPIGYAVIRRLPTVLAEQNLPPRLIQVLQGLHAHFKYLDEQIAEIEKDLTRQLAEDDLGQRLMTVPGIGPITASVLASEMGDGKQYRCGRDFAASLGLVPRQYSTGGRNNLLGISKRGDKNLRRLLVQGARAYMQRLQRQTGPLARWVSALITRRHSNVVACALANKLARIAWAIAAHHTTFETKEALMQA